MLLFAANSISGCAQGISMIAIPWYFTGILNQSSLFGKIYLVITLITLFWGFYCGTLVDKFDRRKIFIALSASGFLALAGVSGYIHMTGNLHWFLPALVFAITVFVYNLHYPNLYAFAQEITEPRHYAKITSYIEIQGQMTFAIAGAVAAILLGGTENGSINLFGFHVPVGFDLAAWSLKEIFLLDMVTYALAIFLVIAIRYESVAERIYDTGSLYNRFKSGLVYLRDNPMVFTFGLASYCVFAAILISGFYLFPIYVSNHLKAGPDVYAANEMYFAIGALLAGFSIQYLFRRSSPVMGAIILSVMGSLVFFSLAVHTNIPLFYFAILLLGLSNAGIRILRMTFLFKVVPNGIIGRAGSSFGFLNGCIRMLFLSLFALPFFHAANNVIYCMLILSIFILVGTGFLIVNFKKIRALAK